MLNIVSSYLDKYLIKNKRVIIAFSGGPDSVCLAYLLNELKAAYNLDIILCYFNHGWRDEAYQEENFTKDFASNYGFKYVIGHAPLNIKKNEEEARNFRYDFLFNSAKQHNCNVVFLAHNKNDNVETLIYRLIKGTSVYGLTSIPERRDIFYRPLLNVSKEEILEYLNKNNLKFMVDDSNYNTKYNRNLIRQEILPLFSKINKKYLDNISNLIINALDTRKIVDSYLDNVKSEIVVENKILYSKFIHLKKEVRFELINGFIKELVKNRDLKTIKKIDDFILSNSNSKISIGYNMFLCIKNDFIYILNNNVSKINSNSLIVDSCGEYYFDKYKIQITKAIKPLEYPNSTQNYCYLNINFPFEFRFRKPGDIFSPVGINGTMKLKDFFINEKIPEELRNNILLLTKDSTVCWVVNYRINNNFRVINNNCYRITVSEKKDDQ